MRYTPRGFPSTRIISPRELNSNSRLRTTCGCADEGATLRPKKGPPELQGTIASSIGSGVEKACNPGVFRGIVGRNKTNPNLPIGIPLDDRVKVANVSVAPYNLMVRFFLDTTGPVAYFGSGAIIGPRHILTAAHVVKDPVTGAVMFDDLLVHNYNDDEFEVERAYVNNSYDDGIPYSFGNPSPLVLWRFARNDYALIVTKKEMFPASTNFFKYTAASAETWKTKELTHLGFPANAPDDVNFPTWPCFNVSPGRPDLFGWPEFGVCDGLLREQKLKGAVNLLTLGCVDTYFDVNRGHSGGPVFEKIGNEYRICGMASATNIFCPSNPGRSYFHALYHDSIAYINEKKSIS